jgi:hypothetical protein
MKLLPILLLNVVTVGGALVVYDQMRTDPATPSEYGVLTSDTSELEARVASLERRRSDNAPVLQSDGIDDRILDRLDDLERMVSARPVAVREASESAGGERAPSMSGEPGADPLAATNGGEGPTEEAIARYRALEKAARDQERQERERKRIDEALTKLDIRLTDTQKDKLTTAYTAYQERRGEVFRSAMTKAREARDAGSDANWGEVMAEARNLVQQEFTTEISSFIPADEAQKISESLNTRGNQRGVGMAGRRGGGGR